MRTLMEQNAAITMSGSAAVFYVARNWTELVGVAPCGELLEAAAWWLVQDKWVSVLVTVVVKIATRAAGPV